MRDHRNDLHGHDEDDDQDGDDDEEHEDDEEEDDDDDDDDDDDPVATTHLPEMPIIHPAPEAIAQHATNNTQTDSD